MSALKLSIFFIVDPPKYQDMACLLAASIRCQFDEDIDLIGYCPEENIKNMSPQALGIFKKLSVDIRPLKTKDRFSPAYPHGNKILAALEPRSTEFSAFIDSDTLFIGKNKTNLMCKLGHVSLVPAASMYWSGQKIWRDIYRACNMDIPIERIWLSRQRKRPLIPYFSAGFIIFPEAIQKGQTRTFPQQWNYLAQKIDKIDILKKRPYLDQMSLPLAIPSSGLKWNILPQEQHYILGGSLKGKPLPENHQIKLIHYRNYENLRGVNHVKHAKFMLEETVGVRRISKFPIST